MPDMVLASSFAESRQILKSPDYWPMSMAAPYRAIGERLGVDFSPTIRLLELLPVFLHGTRHVEVRRTMAINLAAARPRQQQAAERVIGTLPALLAPGRTVELLGSFVQPLWDALAAANSPSIPMSAELAADVTLLFDSRSRLQERLRMNEALRAFIASDPDTAEQRLILLGQNVLGTRPFIGSMAMSLHQLFTAHAGQALSAIAWPAHFPVSALPVTDRVPAQAEEGAGQPADVRRCLLHSPRFSAAENDEALYGLGEHVCLGRPISNTAWSLVTAQLSSLHVRVMSSELTLRDPAPQTDEDLRNIGDPFIRPHSLWVQMEA